MTELVYVDEQDTQANQVLRSAVASGQFQRDEVAMLIPAASIEETIELILEHSCKVLITDYRLSDHKPDVRFTGTELVQAFRQRFARFPCFVTTSFAAEAINEAIDTNVIFPKSDFLDNTLPEEQVPRSEIPFFLRVRKRIAEYDSFVDNTTSEWTELVAKSERGELSAAEAERVLLLDDIIEGLHGRDVAIETHIKRQALVPFQRLIGSAEALIEKIESEIGES